MLDAVDIKVKRQMTIYSRQIKEILTNSTIVFNCSYVRCTDRATVDEQDIKYTDDCKQQLNGFACVSGHKSDKVKPEEQRSIMSFATTIKGPLESSTMVLQHISTSPRETSYTTKLWIESSPSIQSSKGSSDFSSKLSYPHFGKSIVTASLIISITNEISSGLSSTYNMMSTTVNSLDATNKDVTESTKISLIQSTSSRNLKSSSSQYTGLIVGLLVSLIVTVVIVAICVCRLRHTRPFRKENIANDNKISLKNISNYHDVDPNSEKGTTYTENTKHDTSANNGNRMQFQLSENASNNTRNSEDEYTVVVKNQNVASGKENADRNITSENAESLDVMENNYDLLNQEIRPSDIESGNIYDSSRGCRDVYDTTYDTTQHVNSNKNKDESVYDHT
ncbi:unnamed protein product [Mytilus coruscus]|uniref:Uncharacterized protein n=1 Tax=Mytilus coruscus TaxID=42192 RepID=A0A6J8D2Y7_MYTCO|nr:unnamed protein product [Mytilus coruscus]